MLGTADIPEVTMTSTTAPGVTHRWTNLHAYADEVAAARIAAGFHYRFSTVVGQDMGRQIGAHTVKTVMQPLGQTAVNSGRRCQKLKTSGPPRLLRPSRDVAHKHPRPRLRRPIAHGVILWACSKREPCQLGAPPLRRDTRIKP
jgi:hypothetical protein